MVSLFLCFQHTEHQIINMALVMLYLMLFKILSFQKKSCIKVMWNKYIYIYIHLIEVIQNPWLIIVNA